MKTKVCPRCKVEKLRTDFTNDKSRNDGLASACKKCINKNNTNLNTINYIDEIEKFNSQVQELNKILKDKKEEFTKWCQENSRNIKKHFPKKDKIYQIVDIKNAFYNTYSNYGDDYDENEIYYFKPLDISFNPKKIINIDDTLVLFVRGELLDSNYIKVGKNYTDSDKIKISHLIEIEKKQEPKVIANTFTQVYVMIDKNTGYYKIGRSLSAIKREKTLQSEKPTIELLQTFDAKIIDERNLHSMFKHKRIRGEWFDLSGSDMQSINTYFNNKNRFHNINDEVDLDELFT